MPNANAQLSKYFWAVGSFGGVCSGNSFAKHYELHYQPKAVDTLDGERIMQYGCLNFHAKRDGSLKLSLLSRINGRRDGQNHGFIAVCCAGGALEMAKACMPSTCG
jgi:hypothetical protein